MDSDDLKDAGLGALFWGVVGCVVLVIGAACWFGYWELHKSSVNREYEINRQGQPMQEGMIAEDRQLVIGWEAATDPGSKKAIANQFCATLQNVTAVPPDLVQAKTQICP